MVPRTTHEHIDIGGLAQDSIVSVTELAQSGTKPSIFLLLSTIPKPLTGVGFFPYQSRQTNVTKYENK